MTEGKAEKTQSGTCHLNMNSDPSRLQTPSVTTTH